MLRKALSIAVLLSAVAFPQEPQPPAFRSDVQVVLVPVVVRDGAGHPVGGFKQQDFQLFDKGKLQVITTFTALQEAGEVSESAAGSTPGDPAAASAESVPAPPAQPRYIAYVFDDLHTSFAPFAAVREAALGHFQNELPAADRVTVQTFTGRVNLSFTRDRAQIAGAIDKLRVSLAPGHGDAVPCPDIGYYLAERVEIKRDAGALEAVTQQTMNCAHLDHEAAKNVAQGEAKRAVFIGEQDTRMWLATLRRVIRLLAQMKGRRMIVLASSGFYTQTPQGARALAETFDLAAHANVTISTLDVRG